MKSAALFLCSLLCCTAIAAQELYPTTQPASTLPKNALGIRVFDEAYKEGGLMRNITGLRVMYGVSPKLTFMLTGVCSDYHGKNLPLDFIQHNHSGTGNEASTNTPQQGLPYPYIFVGTNLYAQWRFFSSDGQNSHFRMAAYGEAAYIRVPSHDAEPDLSVHTSGIGVGVKGTYLKNHFAATLITGFITPFTYNGTSYDIYGGQYPTTIRYGNAVNYGLSLGYLLYPRHYTNYNQLNWNIYLEFSGKSYSAAKVYEQDGIVTNYLPINTPLLNAGTNLDAAPGLQCIIRSNTRVDFSVAFPVVSKTYTHLYPFYLLGIQRYFYL